MKMKAHAVMVPVVLGLTLGGCFTQSYNHGHAISQDMLDQIQVGSSRENVELVLGSPSTTSNISGDAYYYISQVAQTTAFMGSKIVEQRVVAVYFDEEGYVRDIGHYGLQDGKVFDFIKRTTRTGGADYGFLTQILRGATRPGLGL
ncbi:outer membrane protein assembly factor BamE [Polymorphum gilvum]|uniref:SmpA/OmlA n=1 Tax=Polymorphum gilvum (strain LMG 25793 / CGMCC 1.9160 / SL003B-26A1) TaxID=991905 RepID=F2IWM6_POLGS|nr:outer membrane protein assembly factor BamE [Polymorphum gilvum]ADZ70351.1 SmpA/OmlA [Polymorphum gilvum SL003B-26A1]